jgi:hypothetical protein
MDRGVMRPRLKILGRQVQLFLRRQAAVVIAINRKYAHPRLAVNKSTAFALLMLRLYLIFLVGLLIYKFILTVRGK